MVRFVALVFAFMCGQSFAATIYLCEGYSGGKFWSSVHCREKQALIDRMETVPDGLPFDQQVNIASQQRDKAQRLYQVPQQQPSVQQSTQSAQATTKADCTYIEARIASLDSMARQPQTAQMQDWITAERRRLRDIQFRIRC